MFDLKVLNGTTPAAFSIRRWSMAPNWPMGLLPKMGAPARQHGDRALHGMHGRWFTASHRNGNRLAAIRRRLWATSRRISEAWSRLRPLPSALHRRSFRHSSHCERRNRCRQRIFCGHLCALQSHTGDHGYSQYLEFARPAPVRNPMEPHAHAG